MPANGLITLPTGIDLDDIEAVEAAIKYIPQSALPGPFCDIGFDRTVYPVGAGFDLASLDLAAQVQELFAVPGTLGAHFSADPQYIFEDSAATTPAVVGGPVGAWQSAFGAIAALQDTTANKPTLRVTPETGVYWLDSPISTAALVATFATALGSNCTIVRAGPDGVTFQEGVTIGTTHNIAPAYGFNTEAMLINRALTAPEKALLTRYMGRRVPGLGVELVTNVPFDTDLSGWDANTLNGTVDWIGGAAKLTSSLSGNGPRLYQPVAMNTAKAYSLSAKYTFGGASIGYLSLSAGPGQFAQAFVSRNSSGSLSLAAVPASSLRYPVMSMVGGLGTSITVDNVSLREIL